MFERRRDGTGCHRDVDIRELQEQRPSAGSSQQAHPGCVSTREADPDTRPRISEASWRLPSQLLPRRPLARRPNRQAAAESEAVAGAPAEPSRSAPQKRQRYPISERDLEGLWNTWTSESGSVGAANDDTNGAVAGLHETVVLTNLGAKFPIFFPAIIRPRTWYMKYRLSTNRCTSLCDLTHS